MRSVGSLDRSEFGPDPLKAWHRARRLDRMLPAPSLPRLHGVSRGTHQAMAQQDEARMLEVARRINTR